MGIVYKDFSNNLNGDYVLDESVVAESVLRVLMTNKGQFINKPSYGSNINSFLYESFNDDTKVFIEMEVRNVLKEWVPEVEIRGIDVEYDGDVGFVIKVSLYFKEFDKSIVVQPAYGRQVERRN